LGLAIEETVNPPIGEPSSLTIDCEITQRRTGSTLYFNIRALEQEQDGFESISVDFAHICRFVVRFDIDMGNCYSSTHLVR
jgi:hypothetical protein